MNAPLYPKEIWRGSTPKSSQLYRVVLTAYEKFTFETYAGKDAMGQDRWRPHDDEADGEGWYNIALALAFTISKAAK